jgi:transcriptional regulator GlxA family with amidase domain
LTMPKSGVAKMAFVVSDRFTLIDLAGPMETLSQAEVSPGGFETFTVSAMRLPIKSGSGLTIIPDYTFDKAPDVDIVVVGAQSGNDERYLGYQDAWLLVASSCCRSAPASPNSPGPNCLTA